MKPKKDHPWRNYKQKPEKIIKYNRLLTADEYRALREKQNNKCDICGKNFYNQTGNHICVDHCHKTDKVRGILCRDCNLLLGYAKDDMTILYKAIGYLLKHKNAQD